LLVAALGRVEERLGVAVVAVRAAATHAYPAVVAIGIDAAPGAHGRAERVR
jgi:hypothetical protein